MERQRHLITSHLATIAERTGLEPGKVDTHAHASTWLTPV